MTQQLDKQATIDLLSSVIRLSEAGTRTCSCFGLDPKATELCEAMFRIMRDALESGDFDAPAQPDTQELLAALDAQANHKTPKTYEDLQVERIRVEAAFQALQSPKAPPFAHDEFSLVSPCQLSPCQYATYLGDPPHTIIECDVDDDAPDTEPCPAYNPGSQFSGHDSSD